MNVKKKLRGFIAMITCLILVLGNVMVVQAASYSPVAEYDGLPANIRTNCVAFARYMVPSLPGGLTSKNDKIAIINSYTPAVGAIAITNGDQPAYGHVAYVEAVNGNQIVTLNGGFTGGRITRIAGTAAEQGILGYWNPNGGGTITVSLSWSGERCEHDTANAFLYAKANTNVSGSYTQAGFTLWDEAGNVVASKTENPAHTGSSLEIWYNVTNETGVVLKAGTNYTYQIYTTFNGTQYKTDVKSFRTNGQVANSWTKALSIDDWIYGETAKTPVATPKYGMASFTYSVTENGTYTAEVPKIAGTYYVKATVSPTDQYTALTATKEFHIKKANPKYVIPNDISMTYGQSLNEVELPEGFTWKDPDVVANQVGSCQFEAVFTPKDTQNYQTVNVKIDVTVNLKMETLNEAPIIAATDKTIAVGDTFDPKADVTASDKEDGNITANIEVVKNEVNTTKVGVYEVVYEVTDSQGASYTKTVKVTVKEKKPNNGVDKINNTDNPKTGDHTNVGLFTSLLAISALGIAILAVFKKRKALEHK